MAVGPNSSSITSFSVAAVTIDDARCMRSEVRTKKSYTIYDSEYILWSSCRTRFPLQGNFLAKTLSAASNGPSHDDSYTLKKINFDVVQRPGATKGDGFGKAHCFNILPTENSSDQVRVELDVCLCHKLGIVTFDNSEKK